MPHLLNQIVSLVSITCKKCDILLDFLKLVLYNTFCGDSMINKQNIELFYDYYNELCELLYEKHHVAYLDGMNESFNYLLDEAFEKDYQAEVIAKAHELKALIKHIEFKPEEIRKSVQLGLLKGYKHAFESNGQMTPDSIGLFVGYLIKKLYTNKPIKTIFDPLVGTGNLIYTIINYLEQDIKAYGVDNDVLKCNLARNLGDLIDCENEMFLQDTLTYYNQGFDVVVMDVPFHKGSSYLPYKVINHHLDSLVDGNYFISIIENDFFEQKGSEIFKEEIGQKGYLFGLIKLNETLFQSNPKSILIIRKKGEAVLPLKDFLLVELPSFNDMENLNHTINQLEKWFQDREDDLI